MKFLDELIKWTYKKNFLDDFIDKLFRWAFYMIFFLILGEYLI